jgi:hypothetical protein
MYSHEQRTKIINEICEKIETGLSLRKALIECKSISRTVFFEWIDADKEKADQYARSCELRADSIFEEILEIADDSGGDLKYTENGEVMNAEFVQRSRLRVDARKWMLGKMMPKKYSDKVLTEHSGTDGGAINFVINETRSYESDNKTD